MRYEDSSVDEQEPSTDAVYSKETPDPVAVRAAQEAVAATEPVKRHPWLTRIAVVLSVFVVLIGVSALVLSAVNSNSLAKNNKTLSREQLCFVQLVLTFEKDSSARTQIAADDRSAVDDLVASIAKAQSHSQVAGALKHYQSQRKANDLRRKQFPTTSAQQKCLTADQRKALSGVLKSNFTPNPNSKAVLPKPTPVKKGAASVPSTTPNGVVVGGGGSVSQPKARSQPTQGTAPKSARSNPTRAPGNPQPASGKTSAPSPGLLQVPGCHLSLLGVKVC